MGVLAWPPSEFWSATPHDFYAAIDGFIERRGGKRAAGRRLDAATVEKLKGMLAKA